MNKFNLNSTKTLKNGIEMPILTFGVYGLKEGDDTKEKVELALKHNYRSIDTAKRYENEKSVSEAISSFGLLREEVFITTKLLNTDQGYENTLKAIDESLEKLNLSYVDLYLVHWPTASLNTEESINKREETWLAMEKIYKSGKARSIGVSNYTIKHLEEMKSYANIMPMVNQVEFHPFLYQKDLLDYCKENEIVLESHTSLVRGQKMDHIIIKEIAKKYNKSPASVLIRWNMQNDCIVISGAKNENQIKENIDVFDFELNESDMSLLNGLNEDLRINHNPENLI